MSTSIPVKVNCNKCGGKLNAGPNPTDSSPVTCASCGASLGTWGQVRKAAADKVRAEVRKQLRSVPKKITIKF